MSLPSVLQRIAARKREDVAARAAQVPLELLQARITPADRDFYTALASPERTTPGVALIAEIKHASPSEGVIRADFNPVAIARIYERHAAALSVLCDAPFFGGSHDHLRQVRPVTTRPLLCKDFILEPYQIWEARDAGADAVLLMASLLTAEVIEAYLATVRQLGMEALVEVHSDEELEAVLQTSARIVGVNNRDLKTLRVDLETVFRLAPRVRTGSGDRRRLLVAESGVSRPEEVARLRGVADAALIGTTFMRAPDLEAKIQELGW